MSDTRKSTRIKKYGVCLNDKCEKYKQIQEITHGNMECPECHKKLSPCAPPKKKNNPKSLIVGVVAVVAIGIIIGGISIWNGNKTELESKMLVDSIPIIQNTVETIASTNAIPDTVVMRDTVVVRDVIVHNNTVNASVKSLGGDKSSLRLEYGLYTGAVKDGMPHGQGRLSYTSSRLIDNRDPKKRKAEVGDYVIGEWNNGNLVQGRWYASDGNVKGAIIIGM